MDEYVIPIHGLAEGVHNYEFVIKRGFFEYFNNPELCNGNVKVNIALHKNPQFFELNFHLTGSLELVCDRCLEDFDFTIDVKEKLLVRFGNSFEELDDNLIVIPREESRFEVGQLIYEFAVLSIPYQKVHPVDEKGNSECNPEMIKKLNELRVDDKRNIKADNIDPRWDKLKNLN